MKSSQGYQLDDKDDWMNDEDCWIKANPSLGQTVTYQYLRDQVQQVKNNPSLLFGVLTKNFNMFCMTEDKWLDMQPYSQALGNYNKPTKQFERLVLSNSCVIDKNECVLWCFNNVTLKADHNDNVKPIKGNTKNGKIDCVISMKSSIL